MTLFLDRRELLARFRTGERRALEETYRHYAPVVSTFLSRGFTFASGAQSMRFRGYREPFDLDNALAETFMRAFREPARLGYDGIKPYRNYLLTIARNLVIDELRSKDAAMSTVVLSADFEDTIGTDPLDSPTAEEGLLAKELGDLCARFVGRLGEREQNFFRARFEEARTQVDAGKEVGLSHMQARTLEKRLRQRLLSFLHEGGYLESYGQRPAEGAR
jgi:RNA polymerase sigma-70 factor, ECF subfamily